MKFIKVLPGLLTIFALGCNQGNTISGSLAPISGLSNGPTLPVVTGNNVLTMTVNGSQCNAANSANSINKPCVSITICSTTNSNCQTINDVLVDTGSYGLRIFKSVLNSNLNLTPETSGGKTIADCQQYGVGPDGSADWGEVSVANVTLGGETASNVPIEIIDSTLGGSGSSVCTSDSSGDTFTLDTDPVSTGYNAIMGVGLFAADCGPECANHTDNGQYFACSGSSCTGISMLENAQVTNPVALMPTDNNGVLVRLPSIGFGGVPSLNGYLILGIGTQSNNTPASVSDFKTTSTDEFGDIDTLFNSNNVIGFLDTGSEYYMFDDPSSLPDCSGGGYYCPTSVVSYTGQDTSGSTSAVVPFYIGDANTFSAANNVFIEVGVDDDGAGVFDWGLPFFIGRNVFVGLDQAPTVLGTGPLWAF